MRRLTKTGVIDAVTYPTMVRAYRRRVTDKDYRDTVRDEDRRNQVDAWGGIVPEIKPQGTTEKYDYRSTPGIGGNPKGDARRW